MAKKNVDGQMDMFQLFGTVEELEQTIKARPKKVVDAPVTMHRYLRRKSDGAKMLVAYLDYYQVYVEDFEQEPLLYQFEDTKGAVDFYVEQLDRYLNEKGYTEEKKPAVIKQAKVIRKEEI